MVGCITGAWVVSTSGSPKLSLMSGQSKEIRSSTGECREVGDEVTVEDKVEVLDEETVGFGTEISISKFDG